MAECVTLLLEINDEQDFLFLTLAACHTKNPFSPVEHQLSPARRLERNSGQRNIFLSFKAALMTCFITDQEKYVAYRNSVLLTFFKNNQFFKLFDHKGYKWQR